MTNCTLSERVCEEVLRAGWSPCPEELEGVQGPADGRMLAELGVGGARVFEYAFMVKKTVTKELGGRSANFGSPAFLKRGRAWSEAKSFISNMNGLPEAS
jgi:hypothetical protein